MERAREFLSKHEIPHQEINIEEDKEAARRVENWTGFRSVPTLVVAEEGSVLPHEEPEPLEQESPRNVDRGTIITEPSEDGLRRFLSRHEFT